MADVTGLRSNMHEVLWVADQLRRAAACTSVRLKKDERTEVINLADRLERVVDRLAFFDPYPEIGSESPFEWLERNRLNEVAHV